jgi:dienelactone hydrolase
MLAIPLAGCAGLTPPTAPTAAAGPAAAANALPVVAEYDLGETTITQERFPEDSRFRLMPVRLNGLIAVPTDGSGPFPVVVILHGTHPGCPEIDHVDRWPCEPAAERPNYRGFGYLAEHLAANGYLALSVNINAENTFGFGEPTPGERLGQIVGKHLQALAAASAGGDNNFGVDLKGKVDTGRLALAGHSRGGEMALLLARSPEAVVDGYDGVAGVLQIAPSPGFVDPADGSPVPMGILLPMCDADVINQEGQHFYEAARLAPGQAAWITSAFLERANHNSFNSTLGDDPFGRQGRPDCTPLLHPPAQQAFLADYAVDFLAALFGDASAAPSARARLGMDPETPAPSDLYGLPARVAVLPSAAERIPVLTPADASELTTNRLGGEVRVEGLTAFFCEAGHVTPAERMEGDPCRRATVVIPGQPAFAVIRWERPGAALRFQIPQGKGDLSRAVTISLRAAIDPLSELNAQGAGQAFSIQVTDGTGRTAAATTRADEPALLFPAGEVVEDETFGPTFTGRVPLTTVRVQTAELQGVDLTDIREVALLFDQTQSGALFLADVEWALPPGR